MSIDLRHAQSPNNALPQTCRTIYNGVIAMHEAASQRYWSTKSFTLTQRCRTPGADETLALRSIRKQDLENVKHRNLFKPDMRGVDFVAKPWPLETLTLVDRQGSWELGSRRGTSGNLEIRATRESFTHTRGPRTSDPE